RRTYAGLRSWSLDRHQRPIHVLRSRCHGSVPFDPASPLRKERMVRTVPRHRTSSLAATIADFCNKICHKQTNAPQHGLAYSITSSARASTEAGISWPSALAVLRLITSSYLV